jgi:hypothetical protein
MKIAIVGAGIFGCEIGIALAKGGHAVTLLEAEEQILSGASKVNQARIHTGMHYPRDLKTARESFEAYEAFISKYPGPITRKLNQYYAISSLGSKISATDFVNHAEDLGINWSECSPSMFFKANMVDILIKVPESTFDYKLLRNFYLNEIKNTSNLQLRVRCGVEKISDYGLNVTVHTESGLLDFEKVIVATYANLFPLLKDHISEIGGDSYFQYQACEVALGEIKNLRNTGITVMDGDFWSTMPFGESNLHSLTSVPRTPHITHEFFSPTIGTQLKTLESQHAKFTSDFSIYMKEEFAFNYRKSFFTVKTLALSSQTTAARPTEIFANKHRNIFGVFSGKIASSLKAASQFSGEFS